MQSGPVHSMRQDHLAGLWHARRRRHVEGARAAAVLVRRGAPAPRAVVPPVGSAGLAVTAPARPGPRPAPEPAGRSEPQALSVLPEAAGTSAPSAAMSARFQGVDAVTVRPLSVWARWRLGWTRRHTVVMSVATPVTSVGYAVALGPGAASSGWLVAGALALAGVVAAATVATYLPAAVEGAVTLTSPCAAGGGLFVVLAVIPLTSPGPALSRALAAVAVVSLGLLQRIVGVVACRA